MHVGEISFCDQLGFNIKSDDTKQFILNRIEKTYGIKIIQRHFDKYTERSLSILKSSPHLLCIRSNGNPYFLYLTRYNFSQYCIFIDKKIQQGYFLPRMIIMPVQFDDALFTDTLFEGEMTKAKNGQWYYLINDMLACKGRHLKDLNLPRRLNMLYQTLKQSYYPDTYDPFRICVKRYFTYGELTPAQLDTYLETLPYTTRGLYFQPLFLNFKTVLYNFDDSLVKKVERVKYGKNNVFIADAPAVPAPTLAPTPAPTISHPANTPDTQYFWVRKTAQPDIYDLFDAQGNSVGIACVPTLKVSEKMRDIMADKNLVDKVKLPFTMHERFKKWIPAVA